MLYENSTILGIVYIFTYFSVIRAMYNILIVSLIVTFCKAWNITETTDWNLHQEQCPNPCIS